MASNESHLTIQTILPIKLRLTHWKLVNKASLRADQMFRNHPRLVPHENSPRRWQQSVRIITKNRCCCRVMRNISKWMMACHKDRPAELIGRVKKVISYLNKTARVQTNLKFRQHVWKMFLIKLFKNKKKIDVKRKIDKKFRIYYRESKKWDNKSSAKPPKTSHRREKKIIFWL